MWESEVNKEYILIVLCLRVRVLIDWNVLYKKCGLICDCSIFSCVDLFFNFNWNLCLIKLLIVFIIEVKCFFKILNLLFLSDLNCILNDFFFIFFILWINMLIGCVKCIDIKSVVIMSIYKNGRLINIFISVVFFVFLYKIL